MDTVTTKAKLVGINHVALEVGDIDEALAFYGSLFAFKLRGRAPGHAFLDLGDQFLALTEVKSARADESTERHFGLVVDDKTIARVAVEAAGVTILPGAFLDFLDPWNNRIEIVEYRDLQFTKAAAVLEVLGVSSEKSDDARQQLHDKGME